MGTTNTLDPETRRRNDLLAGHLYTFKWAAKWVAGRTRGLDRDDAAGELAVHVLSKWGEYDPTRSKITTWLRCLTRSVITVHNAKRLARCRDARRVCRAGEGFQLVDHRPTHDDELAEAEERSRDTARALAAVNALPDRLRAVLRWRLGLDGESLTLQQVADRLGCTRERARQLEGAAVRLAREGAGVSSSGSYKPLRRPALVKPRRELPRGYSRMTTGKIRYTRQRLVDGRTVKVNKTFPDLETAQAWVALHLDAAGVPA